MDFAKHVKSSVDLVKVVGEYVRLKRVGSLPRYTGLCPFHTEKTPSFYVHQDHQFYKCFGCDAKGDVFTFVQQIEGVAFYEALKSLAERNGIAMPERHQYSDTQTQLREAVYNMHETAAKVFHSNLAASAGTEARAYLAKRGISPAQIEEFGIGYSDRSGQDLFRRLKQQFPSEQLEASGLIMKRQDGSGFYDRFRGRLMFPIHNESGKVIAFGGRALAADDEPKYLNSPETEIYKKSLVLYNLHRAKNSIRKSDRTVLVEGYMDVIGVYSAGVHNVVASCGTALTSTQVRSAKRHSENIVVNFDPDAAGARASERSIQILLDEGLNVRILELDGDLDPDEYIKSFGADTYQAKLEKAPGYFLWLADRARKQYDMRTTEGRMAGFDFLLPSIQKISDKLERASVANEVADYLGIDRGLVLEEFRKSAVHRQARPSKPGAANIAASERVLVRSLVSSDAVRDILVPALQASARTQSFATREILEIVFHLHENQREFTFQELEARLSDRDKPLLSSIVFGDEDDSMFTEEQAQAYLRVLGGEDKKAHIAELRSRTKEAERSGNLQEALRLAQELNELQKG